MSKKGRIDFCVECRRETEYVLCKKTVVRKIRDKEYQFTITTAICSECGKEMSIPGLLDRNIQEMDEQYRKTEGIVSTEEIKKLMQLYNLGKAPLSLALGFGEVTITRYLSGQIPSKEYSDIIRAALTSPSYMKNRLKENRSKIASTAYNKAVVAADSLENLFSVSDKMLQAIAYIFESLEEVTPLMLQKLLYFIQSIYYALFGDPLFEEDCEAWVHGPVYPEVYNLFRDFKYNPVDDVRFAVLNGISDDLAENEKHVIDLVVNTFGLYGGKALEQITHSEEPWKDARKGYEEQIQSQETMSKERMKKYYEFINSKYPISSEIGLKRYIQDILMNV